ncbi:MAG TPA: hypothetical protein VI588_04260 [Candidatus Gracilibacteria bacterium]|nr:hypothetical protein [Candidatus Gracilibacteria bacterium]
MADTPLTPSEPTPQANQGQPQTPAQPAQQNTEQPQAQQPGAQPQPEAKKDTGAPGEVKMPEMPKMEMPSILKKAENQPPVTSEEKLWGLASYIPLVGLIALIVKPESAYVRLHGRQGLLLFMIFFFSIFVYLLPFIGPLIGALVHIGVIILGAFSMYQAFIGNWWKIPAIGDIAEQIPVDAFTKVTREAVMGPGAPDSGAAQQQQPPEAPASPATPASPAQPEQPAPAQPPATTPQEGEQAPPKG